MKTSWYGVPFHGRLTASGVRFDRFKLTAAHKTLRFGTRLKICVRGTEKCIIVVVNDRGPFIPGRDLDVSEAAAEALGFKERGIVWLETLEL